MRSTFILGGIIFFICSCKKEVDTITTTFQIKSINSFTGDTIGNINFKIGHPYQTTSYEMTGTTDENGNYFGSINHPTNAQLELKCFPDQDLLKNDKIALVPGQHNEIKMEVANLSKFSLYLNCVGSADILYPYLYRLTPIDPASTFVNSSYGNSFYSNSSCNTTSASRTIFYGDWILSYSWSSNSWASSTQKIDTVSILPHEDFVYIIDL